MCCESLRKNVICLFSKKLSNGVTEDESERK